LSRTYRELRRAEIEDISDLDRLHRIERFHVLQIDEYTAVTKQEGFDVTSPRIHKDHNMTSREIVEAIDHHTKALRRVSNRLAELVIFYES